MNWTAVIPLRGQGERKTRLAGRLNAEERYRLSERMFGHVASVLAGCPEISEIGMLSDRRREGWDGFHAEDHGRGINAELEAVVERLGPRPILIIHADLPLLSVIDLTMLLEAAKGATALAPDHHASGTNAVALAMGGPFPFAFGRDSLSRHRVATNGAVRIVERQGLAVDVDTPEDYDAARILGAQLLG